MPNPDMPVDRIYGSSSVQSISGFASESGTSITNPKYGRVALQPQDYVANKLELIQQKQLSAKKTIMLASFVPDFVLHDEGQKIPYQLTGGAIAFMADVSGFTALTEKYSLKGKGGTEQLTKTLSSYMGPLAECILRAGGDIIKYAGDAFLAVWKVPSPSQYPSVIQLAIDCALYIQEKHGSFDTDVGITIRVKIGIGAGEVHQCGIGNQEYHHFVCFGPGVRSASDAEKHCESGEVIVADTAWRMIVPAHFTFKEKHKGFMHVKDILTFENPDMRGRPAAAQKARIAGFNTTNKTYQEHQVRANINKALETKSEDHLRHYVIPPVLKKMDDEVPLEYLNESRQVSICFIKIDILELETSPQFGSTMMNIVQSAFKSIYRQATIMQGCLTKIIMFDKGLTYLVVFGLPGYIHDNQSANALKFSYRVKGMLTGINHVTKVSLGVTSGATYCGVLGHPKRQEYTVIGRKVNKAARLMVYYPGRVTCDQDTLYHSKLPEDNFSLMEAKKLKGIENVGNIYEYVGAESGEDQAIRQFQYPMVCRDQELRYFESVLMGAQNEFNRFLQAHKMNIFGIEVDLKLTKEVVATGLWMLAFEGDNGIGKSRLLSACIQHAEEQRVNVYSVTLTDNGGRMYAVKSLMKQALGLVGLRTVQEREEHLRKVVGEDPELATSLCLLNDLFRLKLPMHARYASADLASRTVYAQHVLSVLLRHFHPNHLLLFVVDDAHLMDDNSWLYLHYLSRNPSVLALFTIRRNNAGMPKLPEEATKILYHTKNVKSIRLAGLETSCTLALSCQMLEVAAIPVELNKIMMAKGKGVPAWIEQVLGEMLRTGLIKIVPNDPIEFKKRGQKITAVDPKYIAKIKPQAKKKSAYWGSNTDFHTSDSEGDFLGSDLDLNTAKNAKSVKRVQKLEISPMTRAIVVKSDTNISAAPIPGTLKEILLDYFDALKSSEQMILKCASVLGLRFSRTMLVHLIPMYDMNVRKYETGLRRLMEERIIRCASRGQSPSIDASSGMQAPVECNCRFARGEIPEFSEHQSWEDDTNEAGTEQDVEIKVNKKFYYCKYLEFAKDNMVEVVYELMTEDQRKEFHLQAAKYLDASSLLCRSCGGDDPAYLYGIKIKDGDLATDPEAALREDLSRAKRKSHRYPGGRKSTTTFVSRNDLTMGVKVKSQPRGSFNTRLDGIRKVFQHAGTQIGDLEIDIIKALKNFDEQNKLRRQKAGCFARLFRGDQISSEIKEWDLTINEMTEQAAKAKKAREVDSRGSLRTKDSASISLMQGEPLNKDTEVRRKRESRVSQGQARQTVDLRGCTCPELQAKVAVDKVKHYTNAEKYGKCFQNLVSAAEASIAVGNSAQALVHLEDAIGLLQAIESAELPAPKENDVDDTGIDKKGVTTQLDFLNGLCYFELGVEQKALDFFYRALQSLGITVPPEDNKRKRDHEISSAAAKLWRRHVCKFYTCNCTAPPYEPEMDKFKDEDEITMKIRVLSYLHLLFRRERKEEMALLISLWQVIFAEDISGSVLDIVPSYCSLMETYAMLSKHKMARRYEALALDLIRDTFGTKEQTDPNGLLTCANLFVTIASIRVFRGEIASSTDAAYLALRIAQTLHDNGMTIHVLPMVTQSLLFGLRVSEVIECLQKLWYVSEEEEDWGGVAIYYTLCLDLLLNTAYPMEPFYTCEKFVSSSDWNADIQLFREYEVQYNIEASLALWYSRYSRWEGAQKWLTEAESHKPKLVTFLSVSAELKLLECELIFVNHYLEAKRYQHFVKARNNAKRIMQLVKKSTQVVPVFIPRFLHLMGYYCKIRSRHAEAEKYMKKAEKIATEDGNNLELEWIAHNRMVWADVAIPTLKFFWLEHTENHTLDWHQSGKVPWANIMYSLPLPTWK